MAELFGTDATDFCDMQQQARRDIATENELRSREAIQWSSKHDEQLDIVMKAISERDLYVEGSRNKHWWRQVATSMSSAMKHEITIRTLKRCAKMLDGRGVQRTLIGFFESQAEATYAHDGVKAAERAYDEARAGETATYQRVSGRLLAWQTRIEKMDSAIQIEQKQFELQIARNTDRIKKIWASATSEQAAVVVGMEDHITAMALRDSTRDELNVAREQYREIRWRDHNSGVSARLHLRLCLCLNLRVCICICAFCICVYACVCNARIDQCNNIHNALACTLRRWESGGAGSPGPCQRIQHHHEW